MELHVWTSWLTEIAKILEKVLPQGTPCPPIFIAHPCHYNQVFLLSFKVWTQLFLLIIVMIMCWRMDGSLELTTQQQNNLGMSPKKNYVTPLNAKQGLPTQTSLWRMCKANWFKDTCRTTFWHHMLNGD